MSLKHAFLAILCAVCLTAPALADTYNGSVFTSSPVSVKAGQEFLIALPSNPTTGYSWKGMANNGNVLVYGSAYEAPASKLMGAGGQQIFVLLAKSAGTSTVTFSYGRPWQKGMKPAKTMTFAVTVTK
jgi:inhibitor of cysteine peptidase